MRAYEPRRMRKDEFQSPEDLLRRDAAGALQHFAVEHSSGVDVTGLSWGQACELAERNNKEVAA